MERRPADRQVLESPGGRVAGANEQEDDATGVGEEGLDRVLPEVRREGHRVGPEVAEEAGGVALRRGADVAPLRVEEQEA